MLTGDNERSAQAIAHRVGVDEYRAQLLPTDKVDVVRQLREQYGAVAMVGDGINDAPAMAVADVGIAMGAAGTDIAIEAGDVVLMSDDLGKIAYVRELSHRTVSTIRQNIAVSLINVAFMVVAALLGYLGLVTGLLLNEASAVFVILNALRLLKWKSPADAGTPVVTGVTIPVRGKPEPILQWKRWHPYYPLLVDPAAPARRQPQLRQNQSQKPVVRQNPVVPARPHSLKHRLQL